MLVYSNNVYELRKSFHISQEKMALDLDISRRSISKIENGEQNLSLDMAYRIAAYFGLLLPDVFPLLCLEKLITISDTTTNDWRDNHGKRLRNDCCGF